jgi:uncharacterized protein YqeY
MSLKNQIQEDIARALKKKEAQKLAVLRFLNAQIKDKEIEEGRREITDEEIIKLINNQIKKSKENLPLFEKENRPELIKKTKAEIEILKAYLLKQLSDQELARAIDQIMAENPAISQPGPLIGLAVKKLAGRVDNQRLAQMISQKIASNQKKAST